MGERPITVSGNATLTELPRLVLADGWVVTGEWTISGVDALGNKITETVPATEPRCLRGILELTNG